MKRIYLNTTKTIMNKLLFRIALFGLVLSATVHAQQGRAQVIEHLECIRATANQSGSWDVKNTCAEPINVGLVLLGPGAVVPQSFRNLGPYREVQTESCRQCRIILHAFYSKDKVPDERLKPSPQQ